jgi:predicted dehydrogenase
MAATGHEHGLRIRVFGDDASLEWRHEDPHHLIVRDPDGGATILALGMKTLSDDATRITRVGLGHPEGFVEAFANFYLDLAEILRGQPARELSIPTGADGLIGVRFVETSLASHAKDAGWMDFEERS